MTIMYESDFIQHLVLQASVSSTDVNCWKVVLQHHELLVIFLELLFLTDPFMSV